MEEVREHFRVLDTHNDSLLSFDEMGVLLRKICKGYSKTQLQQIFCKIDADRNGTVDFEEFFNFMIDGISSQPKIPFKPPKTKASASGVRGQWKQDTLDAHNKLRELHDAPDLTWSDECYLQAKKQADACQAADDLFHGHLDGPSGEHGQNAWWGSDPSDGTAEFAVRDWYDEIDQPGYDFNDPGFSYGAGHFTQVVWCGTQKVGMAKSADGRYVVANYFPAGNYAGQYEDNVLPRSSLPSPQAKQKPKPTKKQGGGSGGNTYTQLTSAFEAEFDGCPFEDFKQDAVETLAAGGTVAVKTQREGACTTMVTILKTSDSAYQMQVSWGGG